LLPGGRGVHTLNMTLKNSSLLAFIGTALVALLATWNFIFSVVNVVRGLIPMDALFSSLIHTFAYIAMAIFFFTFYKAQS
jgi:hypothetical protein